jgi:hypothetical protein
MYATSSEHPSRGGANPKPRETIGTIAERCLVRWGLTIALVAHAMRRHVVAQLVELEVSEQVGHQDIMLLRVVLHL